MSATFKPISSATLRSNSLTGSQGHFCICSHDDCLQKIAQIIRAEELRPNTLPPSQFFLRLVSQAPQEIDRLRSIHDIRPLSEGENILNLALLHTMTLTVPAPSPNEAAFDDEEDLTFAPVSFSAPPSSSSLVNRISQTFQQALCRVPSPTPRASPATAIHSPDHVPAPSPSPAPNSASPTRVDLPTPLPPPIFMKGIGFIPYGSVSQRPNNDSGPFSLRRSYSGIDNLAALHQRPNN